MLIDKISQLELELTTKCNASCPQCIRNYFGSYTWPTLPIVDIDINWLKEAIPVDVWQGLEHIRFCGTYGDPCMHKNLLDIVKWIKNNSTIAITINTNGGIRSKFWWKQLAKTLDPIKDKVFFGIDGLADTNHLHRIGVNYDKVIENLKSFNQHGGQAIWSYLVFEHNQHQIEQARQLSIELGCRNFVCKKTSRFVNKSHELIEQTPVLDNLGETIYFIRPATISKYQNKGYEDFKLVSKEYQNYQNYLKNTEIDCKVKKLHNIYISAEGDVFPCGFLADRMYGYESENHSDHKIIMDIIESIGGRSKINLHHTSLKDIVYGDWFSAVENSWTDNSIQRCAHICGKKSTLLNYANTELYAVWSGDSFEKEKK
jgi:MoaA/NifB/PqqE/SkfB family radical SAM enzyme